MIGGLFKTTSLAALAATAFVFSGAVAPASAADLGGNCCADLEERIAELEATTVRKGNRKVSVQLSGFVAHNVLWWDDGGVSDMYIGDGGNYGSRFRFRGEAKISPEITAGFLYEFGINNNSISSMNQSNGGDDLGGAVSLRDTTVWMRHARLGMVKLGHGSTATDNLTLIDLGGMAGAGTMDIALYNGGFQIRGTGGALLLTTWADAIRGHESFDTTRRNHVLYETPTLAGFSVQTAVAEDNYWDVALRYAGEHHGFRFAFGIGYLEDTEYNGFTGTSLAAAYVADNSLKRSDLKGSASILHVSSGLFVTGAAAHREWESDSGVTPLDSDMWYIAAGIRKNFFGLGDTVLFGEFSESNDFSSERFTAVTSSNVTHWGLGVNQYIDAAAMEVFLAYKSFSYESNEGALVVDGKDFDAVIGGARVNF